MTLFGLWDVSLVLSGISIFIMVALIIARLVQERRTETINARRADLLPKILGGDPLTFQSAKKGDKQTTDLLVELISMVRGDEQRRYLSIAEQSGALAHLIERARSGNTRTKITAIEALTYFDQAAATDALDTALDDRDRNVRLTAALALSQSGRSPPAPFLIEKLSLGSKENSLLLTSILQRISQDRPEEIESLLEDPEIAGSVKSAAVEALASAGRFQVAPVVNAMALTSEPTSDQLANYLRALGTLRHPAGIPAVLFHLSSKDWWVRAAAAEASGKIGATGAMRRLEALLDDEDWWVRFRAGEALVNLGSEGMESLRAATRSGRERVREVARLTLAEVGAPIYG